MQHIWGEAEVYSRVIHSGGAQPSENKRLAPLPLAYGTIKRKVGLGKNGTKSRCARSRAPYSFYKRVAVSNCAIRSLPVIVQEPQMNTDEPGAAVGRNQMKNGQLTTDN